MEYAHQTYDDDNINGLGNLRIVIGWLESLSGLGKFHRFFEIIGGILLIPSGLYMLNAYFIIVPSLAA